MELRDFFGIFCTYKKIFWGIILLSIVAGATYYLLQRQTYHVSLLLNITRDAMRTQTQEYMYDDFYRLQADERFADTVVQWIKSPFMRTQMKDAAGGQLTAKRLSSQVVDVSFSTTTHQAAVSVSNNLVTALNQESQKLNNNQKQDHWFVIQGNQPIVTDGRMSLGFLLLLSGVLGFFVAFWAVLIRHYIGGDTRH